MTELSYVLALLSSLSYGSADFLGGLATKRFGTFSVVVFSQLTGLVLILIALPLLPDSAPTATDLAWGAASGVAGGIGVALLYRGLAIGVMSVVAPVTAVCAVIIPLAAGVAMGERPAPVAMAGVVLAVVAIVLVSQSGAPASGRRGTTGAGIAVLSGIAIGIFLVFLERTGPSAGLWPLVTARIASVSLLALAAIPARERLVLRRAAMPLVLGGGALDMLANIFYLLAVRQGPLSIVATLASLYPASTVILARLILHEQLRAVQLGGVICATVAIVLIVAA